MAASDRRLNPSGWLWVHVVDVAFGMLAIGWLVYVLRITGDFSFWSDDLYLLEQGGSLGGLFEPYNDHLSVVILSTYRVSAELLGLSYTPVMVAGALSLVAVPVSYYATTRRPLGPAVAAVLALSLLWYDGMSLRPALMNHYLALVGAIFCAAALNRGRRADGVLALVLMFSLGSAGGGVVVAGACLLHNLLVRAPWRRWLAVLVPSALWAGWWVLVASDADLSAPVAVSMGDAAAMVRDFCLGPFYAMSLGVRPLAYVLMGAYLLWGAKQLRQGLAAGANFVAWSAAMVMWAVALVRSRGEFANPDYFRYAYLSLGFALLAVVPRRPIAWRERAPLASRRGLAVAAAVVLMLGGVRALAVRDGLQFLAREHSERGQEAKGTLLVLGLDPKVIPDSTPMSFFGLFQPDGSAARVRVMLERYGSPFNATAATADQDLVDHDVARAWLGATAISTRCAALTEPFLTPGLPDHGPGPLGPSPERVPIRLWSATSFTVDVRRFGDRWVRLAEVPAGRNVLLRLPVLNSEQPWEVRAIGACEVGPPAPGE